MLDHWGPQITAYPDLDGLVGVGVGERRRRVDHRHQSQAVVRQRHLGNDDVGGRLEVDGDSFLYLLSLAIFFPPIY